MLFCVEVYKDLHEWRHGRIIQ